MFEQAEPVATAIRHNDVIAGWIPRAIAGSPARSPSALTEAARTTAAGQTPDA